MLHSYVTVFEVNHRVEKLDKLEYSIQHELPPIHVMGRNSPRFFAFEKRKTIQGSFVGRNEMLRIGDSFEIRIKYSNEEGEEIFLELQGLSVSSIERRSETSTYHFTNNYIYQQFPQTNEDALIYLQKGDW